MRYKLAMIAKDISELSNWLHNINSNKPQSLERKDMELMEEKATNVQEFIITLYQYMDDIEE